MGLFLHHDLQRVKTYENYPDEIQLRVFQRLIKKAENTEWGKLYSYKDISVQGPELFRSSVPLNTYEQLRPYMERLSQGAENLLWPMRPRWFAMSSGTTDDRSKYIPVTSDTLFRCHFRGGRDVIAVHNLNNPDCGIFKGKSLVIGGSRQINRLGNNAFCGDLSAILISNLPYWVKMRRVPDQDIALMENWDEKLEKMARAVIKENVTSVSGVPSWTLVLLKKILQITGKDTITQVWPDLTWFMHGGVSFKPYRSQFEKLITNKDMKYLETYNASEGFFGFQNNPDTDDMLLMLDYGIYYEFIPMSDFDNPQRTAIPLSEVKTGVNYAMVISTESGLWRYIIGDTVEFTSLRPYKFIITGRTKHFINAFGEELVVDNASRAILMACRLTGADIEDYTAAPVYPDGTNKACHQWLIEFNVEPDIQKFSLALDNELRRINSDYDAKRFKDLSLTAPQIVVARKDLFHDWLKSKGRLGGQNKVPRLCNNRIIIDELLIMNNK